MLKTVVKKFALGLGLSSLCLVAPAWAAGDVFTLDGKAYHADDFSDELRSAAYIIALNHHELFVRLTDKMLLELYMNEEAKKSGTSPKALSEKLLSVSPPTEKELLARYEAKKDDIMAPYEQIKMRLSEIMVEQERESKRNQLLEKIKKDRGFVLSQSAPVAPKLNIKTDGFGFWGAKDAEQTLVLFSDYQCSDCKMDLDILKTLVDQSDGKVKLVFRDFPIHHSGESVTIAAGAECARQQDKFWPYSDLAFGNMNTLTIDSPDEFAQKLALDISKFDACMKMPATRAKVEASKEEAIALSVDSTPTLFVNGRILVRVWNDVTPLEDKVKQMLGR